MEYKKQSDGIYDARTLGKGRMLVFRFQNQPLTTVR